MKLKKLFKQLKNLSKPTKHWLIISGVGLVSVIMMMTLLIYTNRQTEIVWFGEGVFGVTEGSPERETVGYSHLTGLGVYESSEVTPRVLGIVIDNHWDALPPSGLNDAAVVYEVPVEGNITRSLAIFDASTTVAAVGPVRSARPYFLDWLAEYDDALFMHCGGSPEALSLIKTTGVFDANEFYWGDYYWRDKTRIAPHNLYTSSEEWQRVFSEYGDNHSGYDWQGWKFGELSLSGEAVKGVNIKYATGFVSGWQYNETNKNYEKMFNDELQADAQGNSLIADNVIIQYTGIKVLDEVGRRKIYNIGDGEALVLRDGVMTRGTWKKENQSDRTRFYNENNEEIALKPGRTRIMIVPDYIAAEIIK